MTKSGQLRRKVVGFRRVVTPQWNLRDDENDTEGTSRVSDLPRF